MQGTAATKDEKTQTVAMKMLRLVTAEVEDCKILYPHLGPAVTLSVAAVWPDGGRLAPSIVKTGPLSHDSTPRQVPAPSPDGG